MTTYVNHENISPTAKLVAYWRSLSDIPFSHDVSLSFNAEQVTKKFFSGIVSDVHRDSILAPLLEIRYKCLRNFLRKNAYEQVLEFASGIALRGLAMTEDPTMTYVETDLKALTEEKQKLVTAIMANHKIPRRDNLFFHVANILLPEEIAPSLKYFDDKKPVAVIHEGLFPYLTKTEKKRAAQNIHHILKQFGGAWATPDLDTKTQMHGLILGKDQFKQFMNVIENVTGSNFEQNAFDDESEIYHFFGELGFNVTWEPQFTDKILLSSVKVLSPEVKHFLQGLRLWIMTTK